MSLPAHPPTIAESRAAVKRGSSGWPVYAIQCALNDGFGETLSEDGVFGGRTQDAIVEFQRRWRLTPDGVAGAVTKRVLVERIALRIDRERPGLPDLLIRVMCRAEGGDNPAAVNPYTPPGGRPGTDCGIVQLRCYEPFVRTDLMQAFSPYHAMRAAARSFEERKAKFLTYGWARGSRVRAERLALLAHNWPVGANDIAFEGRLYNPDGAAPWVPAGIRMLDGTYVNTRQEWVDFYAMGTAPHCGPAPAEIRWGV